MALSWNEIKARAIRFSKEWGNETSEDAEAKSFWDDFFNVFGISRRRVATFETRVTKGDRKDGYIDLLWKGHLLIEHKSSGKDLDRAYIQAIEYFPGLKDHELPKYIIVCNFQMFRLYDLDENTQQEFSLNNLIKNIHLFDFIAGYQKRTFKEEDPVNIQAAELMGRLHDKLFNIGYTGHNLELYLVRLLFCLFADDTSIFEKGIFEEYIERRTNEDGSDLAAQLSLIFEVLNTPKRDRLSNLDETIASLPFVNGKLFEEHLPIASFDSEMRNSLLKCCQLNWGKISPAIFGSLFQSVMNPEERRNIGAHYTSEKNILKLIKPLFLDDLWNDFELVKTNKNKLQKFHDKISELRFLDPACGCGNFLVISYRELRLLEIEIIKIFQKGHYVIDISNLIKLNVDRFYGIEYEEFPAQIAQVAMWLMDHQMNMKLSEVIGDYFVRLPLRKSPVIVKGNSLQTDWHKLIDPIPWEKRPQRFDFILGNPPFVGKQHQNADQKADIDFIFSSVKGAGVLDYVACWYMKAARYLNEYSAQDDNVDTSGTKVAFVSTNSIAQGEQVGILWNELFNKHKIKIHFAHRTFKWTNEARGKAAVHVVIIGFSNFDSQTKLLYEYETLTSEPHERKVKNINPYLVESGDFVILKRNKPLCQVPEISFGSMPNDGGHLLLTDDEKKEFIKNSPQAKKFVKPLISAKEFLNGEKRWCLWLKGIQPSELKQIPDLTKRIQLVMEHRTNSNRAETKKLAAFPSLFGEDRQPNSNYIFVPLTTSENRTYIPLSFFTKDNIINNTASLIANSSIYHFGIISSIMHMTWVKYVCGRLKSDFRYSNELVYNNYPWPNPTKKQYKLVENTSQKIIEVRKEFKNNSMSDLYNPLTMPPKLVKAHQALDKSVDLCYRSQPFTNETKRIEFLFHLYEKYSSGLFINEEKTQKQKLKSKR
ncbi:MAG: N-6 DNA methylase [Bacteroidales bacterium]|nr:N-6 DNA methylase [Bacteroidales bacterium]